MINSVTAAKIEKAIRKIPGAIIENQGSAGKVARFIKGGKSFELRYGDLVGLAERVVKNSDGDVLTVMKKMPYSTGGNKGFSSIVSDASGKVKSWVADFGSDKTRYIMTNETYPAAMQFSK